MKEREKEVKESLETSLRERDKERDQHKKEEAMQTFKALLADLVHITSQHVCMKIDDNRILALVFAIDA